MSRFGSHALRMLALLFAIPPCAWTASPASGPRATDPGETISGAAGGRLDAYFEALAVEGFSGTVLVARKGELLLNKGYGLADRERHVPCATNTVFDIGSITKQFTAAGILKLEMAGKLKVADKLSQYLDGVPDDKSAITLHHLLTHTSGLDHGYGEDDAYAPRDLAVRLFLRMPLVTPPGTEYRYSNAGFSLLAAVIERVSGRPYETFLNDEFFRPAGMVKTGYLIPHWNLREVSKNYNGDKSYEWTFNRNWGPEGPYWHLFGNGGILTTTGDLYRWEQSLMGDRALSPEARRKLLTPYVPTDEEGQGSYAYGWRVGKTSRGTPYSGHGGGSDYGVSAAYFRFPDEGILVVVLSNQASFPGKLGAPAFTDRVSSLALAP
ncbi:MAG TPA: serine hydrolase domain-containing protein [Vicinamibacteria bacterium]|jgi:CubicO group peptidase (beta-lactamase class C family)|nr:serine hydrolase domain-containing protein [Vicinamibacteria bacterium]